MDSRFLSNLTKYDGSQNFHSIYYKAYSRRETVLESKEYEIDVNLFLFVKFTFRYTIIDLPDTHASAPCLAVLPPPGDSKAAKFHSSIIKVLHFSSFSKSQDVDFSAQ